MSIQAAQRMGLRCVSLDSSDRSPAAKIAPNLVGKITDPTDIRRIFELADYVTLENEFIPAERIAEALQAGGHSETRLVPGLETLATIQDKLLQRQALIAAGVSSPKAVALVGGGREAVEQIGFPMVLKARFGGYDGKGTRYARSIFDLDRLSREWSNGEWLAEQFVHFKRELAVMVVATPTKTTCFPTVQTVQTDSVCDLVMPCTSDAAEVAINAVRAVKGTGLFGVELFEREDGAILVNEIAPRPHNSGHYTLDWGGPSQFECHIRVALGLPMPELKSEGTAVMANLLGQHNSGDTLPAIREALKTPNAYVHWYEKDEAKPGRKMGHINVVGSRLAELDQMIKSATQARENFYRAWTSLSQAAP
jgi:5-(carboxyamino)imidazole ribonucleotide synthase